MMNSREILEFITDNEKVTLSKLSQLMGIKRAQPLYDIRDGKIKSISANYADKILSVFPEYSRAWLITGEGQPFFKNENEVNLSDLTKRFLEEVERIGVSFYNIAKSTGAQEAMFTKIKKGIQEPSKKFLSKFAECFPDANMRYIYLGNEENADEDSIMATNAYSERFLQVIDKLGVTDYFIWNNCDAISKAQMSHIRTGKGGASISIIESLCNKFPQVNANYILTGKGDMFLNNESSAANSDTEPKFSTTSAMYETLIKDRDEQIEELKAEVNKLIGENNIMREQLGMKERKISSKSA